MTSNPPARTVPHTPLRLRLKPNASTTGYVDGAWWPRSRDLTAELVALAEVLAVRLGRIVRVAYALSTWNKTPRKVEVAGFRAPWSADRSLTATSAGPPCWLPRCSVN